MNDSRSGRTEFFTREAGEYLRELEPLIGAGTPPLDALVRVARGLRGAAMLAGPATFARAAGELEALIRQLRHGSLHWAEVAPHLRHAVGRFRDLVGAVPTWDRGEDAHAAALAATLRSASGPGEPGGGTGHRPAGSGTAAREYVAGELDRSARALGNAASQAGGGSLPSTSVDGVRHALLALRGIATIADHPPLPQVLDAAAAALTELLGHRLPRTAAPVLLGTTGSALGRLAATVRSGPTQEPAPTPPEVSGFAELLNRLFLAPGSAVPITDLMADAGPQAPLSTRPTTASASALDLSALAASLRHAAGQFRTADTPLTWGLMAFAQAMTFRSASGVAGHPPVARFLSFVTTWIESAAGRGSDARLIDLLDRAGREVAELRPGQDLAATLDALTRDPHPGTAPAAPAPVAEVPIGALLAEGELPIVPISQLLAETVVPIESLAPDPIELRPADRTPLERSLSRYARLANQGRPSLTLGSLLEPPAPEGAVGGPVPIQQLLYRGRRALARAREVRADLERAFRSAPGDHSRLEPLMQELLDLVPLALAGDS